MEAHPLFPSLAWHDDAELATLLGSPVRARRIVHEWPLTRTELVELDDGRRLAYKTQTPPSVEPEFYAGVGSPLLVPCIDLGKVGGSRAIALDWVEAPTLASLPDEELPRGAEEVARAIGEIDPWAPVLLDISSDAAWMNVVEDALGRLRRLVGARTYERVSESDIDAIESWAGGDEVVAAASSGSGIAHGDLTADEVLVTPDGIRVIDWQRPVRGPWQLDLVSLLRGRELAIPPELRVYDAISAFLLVRWAALAQTELLPQLPPRFTEGWVLESLPRILGG